EQCSQPVGGLAPPNASAYLSSVQQRAGSYQLPPAVLIGHRDKGRPWCYAGNGTRTFTPDAGTEQRPKKAVTGKPDDIERVTSGLAGGRRERSRKTTSPAAYPTTSARTSSETGGGDDELHRVYKIHRFVVKDLRGKSRAHSVCGCAFFLGDRSIRDPSR